MSKLQPQVGYAYPIAPHQMRILCERVCQTAALPPPCKFSSGKGSAVCFRSRDGAKNVDLIMSPWRQPANQLVDVAFFVVIVWNPADIKEARYYYISLTKPDTIAMQNRLKIDAQNVREKMIEFVLDARKPLEEATYKPDPSQAGTFGSWDGGLQPLPSMYTTDDPFITPA